MHVFVIDKNMKPLIPCHSAKARKLLKKNMAKVFRMFPFSIQLFEEKHTLESTLRLKIDPGSRFTGFAILNGSDVIWASELQHRGKIIKDDLESRRAIRRNRRNRKTRYRKPRFLNRIKEKGWLPPSLMSRVYNIMTWVKRIRKVCPITSISMELVKFDMQQMNNPEISGVEYQQGELAGYEVREYLLEKWNRKCAYCGKKDIPLQIEHITPKSRGGSNRISNLTLACEKCNQKKGTQTAKEFGFPNIQKLAKQPLKDAAAVNSTRWRLFEELKSLGLPIECGSGGMTKFNRTNLRLPKHHWTDAVAVGKSTPSSVNIKTKGILQIKAQGYGKRQMCITDKYGFPVKHRGREKLSFGFQTGDMVRAEVPDGLKVSGRYVSRVSGLARGKPTLCLSKGKNWWVNVKYLTKIHSHDGYSYEMQKIA